MKGRDYCAQCKFFRISGFCLPGIGPIYAKKGRFKLTERMPSGENSIFTESLMGIYVNRTLNMKQIAAIGFDMDYTLVRYDSEAFEEMTYKEILKKLIEIKKYPETLNKLKFQFNLAIRGLVIDKPHGNVLKLSTYSRVKHAYHGV